MTQARIAEEMRQGPVAGRIREARLIAVLRRVAPQARLLRLVDDFVEAGVVAFEITLDGPTAPEDLAAARRQLDQRMHERSFVLGAGTVRTVAQLQQGRDLGADFAVSPVLDPRVLAAALELRIPFFPGAFSPTEVDVAWRQGATFVKVFPGSSAGPQHIREIGGSLPEIELIVTGDVDAANARSFLDAGAIAVGIGSAIARADGPTRRAMVANVRAG